MADGSENLAQTTERTPLEMLIGMRGIDRTKAAALVVEDDPAVNRLLAGIVTRDLRLETIQAEDGAEGLEVIRVRAVRDRLVLVLTDVNMPKMTGPDMLRAASGEHLLDDVAVIVSSGEMTQNKEYIDQVTAGGRIAQEVLPKPSSRADISVAVQRACLSVFEKLEGIEANKVWAKFTPKPPESDAR